MPAIRTSCAAAWRCALAWFMAGVLAPLAPAQSVVNTSGGSPASSQAQIPTLQSIDASFRSQTYTAIQLRRFVGANANIVTVREKLEVQPNGTANPTFALTFLGVQGEPTGSPLDLEWRRIYGSHGPRLFTHGGFRVRDLARANANYSIHDFGSVVRANRTARRMVVFPGNFDKALWIVDVDVATGLPLYAGEFGSNLQVLSEVEVVSLSNTVAPLPSTTSTATLVPTYAAAKSLMGDPADLVDPTTSAVAPEYQLERIEVDNDPINGQWKMTMTYTDGIDHFMVVEAPKTPDWMATLPARTNDGHVIGRFRDPAMSLLVFWEGGVSFHVAGRGSLERLDDLARSIYLQAISTN